MQCWDCSAEIKEAEFFCPACNKIQPPSQTNHFTLLDMPRDFDLGAKKLEVAYFSLQTKLHPDRFSKKSEKEKLYSMQQSMSINQAYETLKSPLTRAEYLLKLEGIIVNADNATVKPCQILLAESLEARERLHEAKSEDEIRALTIETMENKLSTIDALKQNLHERKLEEAAQNTIRLRYLEKLNEEIKAKG